MKYILLVCAWSQLTAAFSQSNAVRINAGKNQMIRYSNPASPLVEPHLAIDPTNDDHMVITAIVFDSAAPTDVGDHIVVFTTTNSGKAWKQSDLEMTHAADPWISVKNEKEVALIALAGYKNSAGTSLVYYSSSDGGISWNIPINLGRGHDHPTMITDPKSGRLYILSSFIKRNTSGERIGYAYLNHTDDWKTFKDSASLFAVGKNNSNTLTAAVHPSGNVILPYIEHPSDNHSHEDIRNAGGSLIRYAYTKDGTNYTGPLLLTDNIGIAKGFAVMAIDQHSKYKGRMYFVKNTGTNPAHSNGLFIKYADKLEGPWSHDIRIDHNENKEKFIRTSAIAVNRNGVIGIAWVDRRNDPDLKKNDVYFTVSVNGGISFEREIRVTDVNSDPLVPGNGKTGERFMSGGDYMGLAAKADGSFQVVWADSRSGVFQLYTSNITITHTSK